MTVYVNTVVGTLQKWPAKAGGRSPKSPAVYRSYIILYNRTFVINLLITMVFCFTVIMAISHVMAATFDLR